MTLEVEAKRYAYRRLAMRSHHTSEMREALAKREYPAEIIEQIVGEMTLAGYLNDADWIAGYVRRMQAQKYGPRAIRAKLRIKGISEDDAGPFLEEAGTPETQEAQIASLLATRYRSRDLSNHKERQKLVAALVRKGFDLSAIFSGLEKARGDNCTVLI